MPFDPTNYHHARKSNWIGRDLYVFEELPSTNAHLKENRFYNDGDVILADAQTHGRGRKGRNWASLPEKSLLFSIHFTPNWSLDRLPWLMMIAGIATVQAIREQCDVSAELKWPNDILLKSITGEWQKLGGILVETEIAQEKIERAIIGIGLNVNLPQSALPTADVTPTSLQLATKTSHQREPLLASLITHLEQLYTQCEQGYSPHELWRDCLGMLHEPIYLKDNDLVGIATDVTASGDIEITDEQGKIHQFALGDISLRPQMKD